MLKRKTKLVRKTKLKATSKKVSSKRTSMRKMYEAKAISDHHTCTGCGGCHCLSHSHILSRRNLELADDPRNVTYHCLPIDGCNGCSDKWEQVGIRLSLLDYIQNMEYIKEVSSSDFSNMILKDYSYFEINDKNICIAENYCYLCKEYKQLK